MLRSVDEHGIPPGSTTTDAQLLMQLGIFFVSPRVCKGSCGSPRTLTFSVGLEKRLFSRSPGHFSFRARPREVARSPQRPQHSPIQIKGLRADESIRIDVRASTPVKQLLQEAARACHKNVSEFLLDAGVTAAAQTLADRRQFVLGETQWQAFQEALDRPVQSKPRLKKLLREPGVLG